MIRIAFGVEYDGGGFYGFQRQRQSPTVQGVLEHAFGQVAAHEITVHGSGRTDTGVHASGQVGHFDTSANRDERAWLLGANANLPETCAVTWVRFVDDSFHSRFSATGRRYRYRIVNRWPRPALERSYAFWMHHPLDADAMHQAAQALVGEHDYSSFRARRCQASHATRRVRAVEVVRDGELILVDIAGNAFLHHMVRNIVGSLILVGRGERSVDWMEEVLTARDRTQAGPTAPAHGLCLTEVQYPRALAEAGFVPGGQGAD